MVVVYAGSLGKFLVTNTTTIPLATKKPGKFFREYPILVLPVNPPNLL